LKLSTVGGAKVKANVIASHATNMAHQAEYEVWRGSGVISAGYLARDKAADLADPRSAGIHRDQSF
jgi:hypothetical protein